MATLQIAEREIRAHGHQHLLGICWQQWLAERRLARRGVRFRSTDSAEVEAAYGAMTPAEFEAVNARQAWANWRTIPRALSGNVPDRPLRVLDLGCGAGTSTQVLAFYCPPGSVITGYDLVPALLAFARRRAYRHRGGAAAHVDFRCQQITEAFRQAGDAAVPGESVDVVNSSGVVGQHLSVKRLAALLEEVRRVLCAGGVALLDPGPALHSSTLREKMKEAGFEFVNRPRSWFGDPNGAMVFRNPAATEVPRRR